MGFCDGRPRDYHDRRDAWVLHGKAATHRSGIHAASGANSCAGRPEPNRSRARAIAGPRSTNSTRCTRISGESPEPE